MSDHVITLSSDDELECLSAPSQKKLKVESENLSNAIKALRKLDVLKEISTSPVNGSRSFKKCGTNICSSLTIVINDEGSKSNNVVGDAREPSENIVVIDEGSSEENAVESIENSASSDCLVIPDDESEDCGVSDSHLEEQSSQLEKELGSQEIDRTLEMACKPSTSKASEAHALLDQFIETCSNLVKGSKYESKIFPKLSKMKKCFNNCESIHNEPSFKRMLQEQTNVASVSAANAVVSFQVMYNYIMDNESGTSIEVPQENLRKIKKLEKTCKLLLRRLKKLEETEVEFDDDYDSAYIQIDRYSQRLNKVYNKYCQLLNKNPNSGRLLYEKLQFISSKYNEINRAISKAYKRNKFPTYYDVEKCIRKCVKNNSLGLSEEEIKSESKDCFVKMGNLLQLRRKKELYEVHCGYIANEDPANKNSELKTKLQQNCDEGENKMKQVVEKYVKLQENNISVELSEDSDNSNYKSSDSD